MREGPKAFGPTLRRNMVSAVVQTIVEVVESRPGLLAAAVIGGLAGAVVVALIILRLRGRGSG